MNINRLIKQWEKELGPLTFGKAIESLRECEEMSLTDYAKELGITKVSLKDLETGKRIPTPKRVAEIAEKMGLSEKVLIELALRDGLRKQGLNYNVKLESA